MGAPRRLRKKYKGPQHPYNAERFEEELKLVGEYGLRNKKELWKVRTQLGQFRRRARKLLALDETSHERTREEELLLHKLTRLGLIKTEGNLSIDQVLNLQPQDLLERRLQTVVYRKGLVRTPHQARQLIAHGHITVRGRRVTVPSFHMGAGDEEFIDYSPGSPYYDPEHPMRAELVDSVGGEAASEVTDDEEEEI